VGLSMKLVATISVASAVAGVAGYCGADEVLPTPPGSLPQPNPFPQAPSRFFPSYRGATRIRMIETGADHALIVAHALAPPLPGVPPPDFHVPRGPGRLVC
jgi:hypothetical protein